MSNSHTKFGWISAYGLGGDSIKNGQTEVITIPLSLFVFSVKHSGHKGILSLWALLSSALSHFWFPIENLSNGCIVFIKTLQKGQVSLNTGQV